ncbi:MAG: SNF2 helicase associated domain-containing protein [Lachnospiraceae bacterium]|nr:SNF2 helicase associated domain-containing protein [Lachnospiraceae bacterium]
MRKTLENWEKKFNPAALERAKASCRNKRVVDLKKSTDGYTAAVLGRQRYEVAVKLKDGKFSRISCQCPVAKSGNFCEHMAAVLYAIEEEQKQLSEDVQRVTKDMAAEEARREAARLKKEEEARKRAEKKRIQKEAQKIAEQKRQEEQKTADQERSENPDIYIYFDGAKIKESLEFSAESIRKGAKLLGDGMLEIQEISAGYDEYGDEQLGQILAVGRNKKGTFPVQVVFSRTQVKRASCNCPACRKDYWSYFGGRAKCEYIAAALCGLEDYLQSHNLGDATDRKADVLLSQFREKRAVQLKAGTISQEGVLQFVPRLTRKNGRLFISFRIGIEKLFVVKSLTDFCEAVRNSMVKQYGSKAEFNHGLSNFTQEAQKWVGFVRRYVQEERQIEQRLMEGRYYSALRKTQNLDSLKLFGGRLDECFELMAGEKSYEYEDKDSGNKKKYFLTTACASPRASMQISPQRLKGDRSFHGIKVSGTLPELYQGDEYAYYIDEKHFYRADRSFVDRLMPLANLSDGGQFDFRIGRNHMSEFYYQILPGLEDIVDITELQGDKIRSFLPPEAQFIFYLDAERNDVTCRLHARYGEREVSVVDIAIDESGEEIESFREINREEEILYQTLQWFPFIDPENDELCCNGEEDKMYQIMENGVSALLTLGEVQCTDRFRSHQIISRVKVSVGVSVSGGLLDMDISTEDISAAELLELLQSYRLKKKYHRLKDGTFVNLGDSSLAMLTEMMDSMHMKPSELADGKMQLPIYRTLYLDRMLEAHESVYKNRDSHFREMVKDFKTINDSDFEEPKCLSRIMRNYQKNGYKWLRTLEAWNLGGILADDMGLGKTLQMIAVLLAAKQEGKTGTSLVIAPASLVFNWGEEFRRFAPEISFVLVTGTAGERQEKINAYQAADVLITSYDLLKRDIVCYEDKQFQYEIIDEAQYIKNHTTAAAKAVKLIKSTVRYALTGTPIENRLSELWSIFDYLMPGFLYGYETFKREIETPIVKNNDEQAMKRLQKMVSPFILRRLKEDVLRDLPEKLEEVRYVRLEGQQQKLYDAQVLHMKESIAKQDAEEFNKNKMLVLAELTKLRQICCDPSLCFENYRGEAAKVEACMELIQSALDGGHRILLFSQFTSMLEILQKRLEETQIAFFMITGAVPKEKRLQMVKAFNEGNASVFLISLKAGGVGLNLTGADVVIHYDPWWNLAAQNQATDRAHRIGQTKKVTVYKMIAKHSVEEKILKLQETKRELAEQIIGGAGGEIGRMDKEELLALLDGN